MHFSDRINTANPMHSCQAAGGSMPGAGLFFCTYETAKPVVAKWGIGGSAGSQMIAASLAETVACLVRVPTEVWS